MKNSFQFLSLVLSPKRFGNGVLEIRTMDNEDGGELFSFLVREEIDMVILDDGVKLFSPPRERRKPFKECPCERMSLVMRTIKGIPLKLQVILCTLLEAQLQEVE